MCAILGFIDKAGVSTAPIGQILLRMLLAVGCRGPDSTGVAIWGGDKNGLVLQVKLGEHGDFAVRAADLLAHVETKMHVREHAVTDAYLRLVLDERADTARAVETIENYA